MCRTMDIEKTTPRLLHGFAFTGTVNAALDIISRVQKSTACT